MKKKLMMLLVVFLLGADAPKADAVKEELKKFEGSWKLVAANMDGKEMAPEEVKKTSMVVSGGEFTIKSGVDIHKGKFSIDPDKKLKTIDVEFTEGSLKGFKVHGIYEIKDDTRKSCFTDSNTDRPTDFEGGTGRYVWEWKQDKP